MITWVQQCDMQVLQYLFSARSDVMVQMMAALSAWGEWTILLPLAALLAIGLFLSDRASLGTGLLVSVFGSAAATVALKAIVARPRPPLHFWAIQEPWYSFPSAHAALSLAFWGFLAYAALCTTKHRGLRRAAVCIGALLPLLIGFSRLYLGVHYLSDVIGGFVVGGMFLFLAILKGRDRS